MPNATTTRLNKNGAVIDDAWQMLREIPESGLPDGKIIVPLTYWLDHRDECRIDRPDVPDAESAAMSKDTPARISGEVISIPRSCICLSRPITVARCGSQRMICAPMSISLSTKKRRLSNIF